jgi:hypothetical protein
LGVKPSNTRYGETLTDVSTNDKDTLTLLDSSECDKFLNMIVSPEFVENLSVLKQASGSTICASTQSEGEHGEMKKDKFENENLLSPKNKNE